MVFPTTPLDVRTEIQIGGAWTDVTADTYTRDPITITRGTADEASSTEPSSCSLTLNNRHGKYSPRNPMSPYYGLIGRNTPVRVSVPGAESYLSLDGTTAGVATTPDAAALDITGDLDIRVEATADWYAAGSQALIGKWITATNQKSYLLRLADGLLTFNWSTNGSVTSFVTLTLPTLPRRAALRATLDVNNGAGGLTCTLYWAESMAGPWNVIGSPVTSTGVTSIYAGTAALELAPLAASGVTPLRGRVHRAEVRSGIGGTVVASPDFRAQTVGATGFTDSAGRVWSTTGTAAVTNRQYRFVGEISAWPSRWDVSGKDVWVPVEAAGILRRMGQGKKALDSTLRRRIPSGAGMLAYWPMEDEQGATAAYSPLPNVRPLAVTGLDFAAEDSLSGSSPLPMTKNPASLSARVPGTTTSGWQVEFVYNLPTMPAAQTEIMRVVLAGAVLRTVVVYASTAGIRIEMLDKDDAVLQFYVNTGGPDIAAFAGVWNRLAIYSGDAGSGQTRVQATWRNVVTNFRYYASTFATTGQGRVTTVRGSWGAGTEGMAIGHLAVSATPGTGVSGSPPASTIFEGADDGFAGETALDRMARLTDEEAAQLDLSWLDGDSTTASERMGPQRPNTLLDLLGEAAETDGGILYERLDRAALVYRDRASLYNQRVALALDYLAKGEVPPPLEPTEDDQKVRNDVTVTRSGGSAARVVEETGPLSVNPPPAGVGPYDESVTLSLYDDMQPERIAGWRVHLGTVDEARYPTISVWLHAAPHLTNAVLALDIGDRLTIANPPAWLPPGLIDQHIRGYTEVLGLFEWSLTYNCAPASPWQVGVEGDPVYARADTAGTVLAAAVSDTATALPVTTTVGPRWVDTATYPTEFPFDVSLGGEQVTVAGITGVAEDVFARTVSNGWGTADSGQAWVTDGGSASNYAVASGTGRHVMPVNTFLATVVPVVTPDVDLRVDFSLSALPVGDSAYVFPVIRYADVTRFYFARVQIAAGGAMTLTLRKRVGAETQLGSSYTTGFTYTAGARYTVRLAMTGSTLTGKVWLTSGAEPAAWQLSATDTDLVAPASVGVRTLLGSAISNAPLTALFDNLYADPQQMTVTRSVNGIVKAQTAGTDVRLAYPTIAAL
ncbi:hypothetical protein ACIBKZ_18145 [Streptomyces sp. NPDC050421]|uniref:hypothetical protein n=1 Tax=Streptomyces sp. NPDC050421 TaxID=3365613 RepID=UPI003787B49A